MRTAFVMVKDGAECFRECLGEYSATFDNKKINLTLRGFRNCSININLVQAYLISIQNLKLKNVVIHQQNF